MLEELGRIGVALSGRGGQEGDGFFGVPIYFYAVYRYSRPSWYPA